MKVIKTLAECLHGDERMARRLVEDWKNDLDKFLFDGDNYELETRSYQADYDSEPEVEVMHAELINPVCAVAFILEGGLEVQLVVDAYQGDENIYLYVNDEDVLFLEQRDLQDYMYRRMDEALEDMYRRG